MAQTASVMVGKIEDALASNPGVNEMTIDGMGTVKWDRARLMDELAMWRSKAAMEAISGPPIKMFSLRPGAAN
jgi:hypothetical protein